MGRGKGAGIRKGVMAGVQWIRMVCPVLVVVPPPYLPKKHSLPWKAACRAREHRHRLLSSIQSVAPCIPAPSNETGHSCCASWLYGMCLLRNLIVFGDLFDETGCS